MKYSIEFQIAGLFILILLAVDFFTKGHIENRGIKVFPLLLLVQIASVVLDIVKTIVVAERLSLPAWIPEYAWKLYSISIMTFALFYSKYCTSMCENDNHGKYASFYKFLSILGWIAFFVTVIVFVLFAKPVYIAIEKGYIVAGIGVVINAVFCFSAVGLSMGYVFLLRKNITGKYRVCVYISWFGCLLSILCEYKFHILLMGFALPFVTLIIYFTLENPDIKIIHELEEAREHADVANRAKTVFLATMSHEIRTPMSIIMGMNEMVLRECDDSRILSYSKDIKDASNNLLLIINDVLDFSKIESGTMNLEERNFDTRNFFKSLIKQVEFASKEKNLKFNVLISENIPSILSGDDVRLRQIITNLLSNAIKYTNEGNVTLKVDCETKPAFKLSDEDDYEIAELSVYVSDTGIGIKEEDQGKIFESFHRVRAVQNARIEGTGLGLTITQTLLHLMGSEIKLKSKYGEGSEFSFKLNLKVVNSTPIGNILGFDDSNVEKPKALMFTAPTARILNVDDSNMNLYIVELMLKKTQIQIDRATSGAECLEKVLDNKYDVIFLDHMMPEMDGIETMKSLNKIDSFVESKTPVVALTANAVIGAKDMYLNSGFSDYISKPIDSARLEEVLLKYIPEEKILRDAQEN